MQHANADGLSQLPIEGSKGPRRPSSIFQLSFLEDFPVSAAEIGAEMVRDSLLATVYQYVMEGRPSKPVQEQLKPCYQRRDYLSTDQGCIL